MIEPDREAWNNLDQTRRQGEDGNDELGGVAARCVQKTGKLPARAFPA